MKSGIMTTAFMMVFLLIGCDGDHKLIGNENAFKLMSAGRQTATIDICRFHNSRLTINGACSSEGQPILILPTTKGDTRIIGSPKCSNGRYEVITSKFGRPPCGVVLDYGGNKEISAIVEGSEMYCN